MYKSYTYSGTKTYIYICLQYQEKDTPNVFVDLPWNDHKRKRHIMQKPTCPYWKSKSSKQTCGNGGTPFFKPRGFCRDSPSSDGRVRLKVWMDVILFKYELGKKEKTRMDAILFVKVLVVKLGGSKAGRVENFATHGQNTHPHTLETKMSPWSQITRQVNRNQVSSGQVFCKPKVDNLTCLNK